jgi:biopolymer transport protein ExbB
VIKLERGVGYLDTIYAAAPLIGLIGTVTGLLGAFSVVDPQTKMPDPVQFTESVGYALSATILGLCIALPALIGSGHLQRVISKHAAQLDVLLERVLAKQGADVQSSAKQS